MMEQEITKLILKGDSDEDIIRHILIGLGLTNTFTLRCDFFERYKHVAIRQQKNVLLLDFAEAGYYMTLREYNRDRDIYRCSKDGVKVQFTWFPAKHSFDLSLTMPDNTTWDLMYYNPGEPLRDKIRAFLPIWRERQGLAKESTIKREIARARKKIKVSQTTIDSILHCVTHKSGLSYNIHRDGFTTELSIKLQCKRCLFIRMRPDMNLTRLADIKEKIAEAGRVLNHAGALIQVKTYGNKLIWTQAAAAEEDFTEEDTP